MSLLLLFPDTAALTSSAAGSAVVTSSVVAFAASAQIKPPLGLLLLYEDNPNVVSPIASRKGTATGTSSVLGFSSNKIPGVGSSIGQVSVAGFSPQIAAGVGSSAVVSLVSGRGFGFTVFEPAPPEGGDLNTGNVIFPPERLIGDNPALDLQQYTQPLPPGRLLNTLLKYEFGKQAYCVYTAIKISFQFYTLRVLDSAGFVNINGEIFTGADPTHGTLVSFDSITDGIGDDAPAIRIVLTPPDNLSSFFLMSPDSQGAIVQVLVGAVEPNTGTNLGITQVFLGEIDTMSLEIDEQLRQLTIESVSVFERFFDDDEGIRLTDSWHENVWPGEQGLVYVTDIDRQIPWGQDAPLPAASTAVAKSSSSIYNSVPFNFPGNGFGTVL